MSSSQTNYETLYGVSLLDDLHNYFPAILYDPSRFRTVQGLLHYIQTCARNRFDLFSFGQRHFLNSSLEPESEPPAPSSAPTPAPVPATAPVRPTVHSTHIPRAGDTHISAQIDFVQDDLGLDSQSLSLLNLFNILGNMPLSNSIRSRGFATGSIPSSFLEPVVVRPTSEQVESGSTRTFPGSDSVCAICQDSIPENQMARRLTSCGHTFHISCIDTWFQRDVRCPTCRHDIRDSNQQPSQESTEDSPEEVN